jgi:hypothetical protein
MPTPPPDRADQQSHQGTQPCPVALDDEGHRQRLGVIQVAIHGLHLEAVVTGRQVLERGRPVARDAPVIVVAEEPVHVGELLRRCRQASTTEGEGDQSLVGRDPYPFPGCVLAIRRGPDEPHTGRAGAGPVARDPPVGGDPDETVIGTQDALDTVVRQTIAHGQSL